MHGFKLFLEQQLGPQSRIMDTIHQAIDVLSANPSQSAVLLVQAKEQLQSWWSGAGDRFQTRAAHDSLVGKWSAGKDETEVQRDILDGFDEVIDQIKVLPKKPKSLNSILLQLRYGLVNMLHTYNPSWMAA